METNLNPRKEHSNGNIVVELCLPETNAIKVCILIWIIQKSFQQTTNDYRTIKMEEHSNVTKQENNNIKNIPETFEVLKFMFLDLNDFFNGIINEE